MLRSCRCARRRRGGRRDAIVLGFEITGIRSPAAGATDGTGWNEAARVKSVMPGLVPGIHVFLCWGGKDVDGRNESGHDGASDEH